MNRIAIDPKITLGSVLSIISIIGTVMMAYSNLKAEVTAVDRRLATLECSLAASGMIATSTPCTLPYRAKLGY